MTGMPAAYPPAVKPKTYRTEFRTRFCEALLARYVLVFEGRTEFDALPAAARRLCDLDAKHYKSLENLGVAIIDARGDTNVAPLGKFFRSLGKVVFAVFDKQTPEALAAIAAAVDHPYESATNGFENLVLDGTSEAALRGYAIAVVAAGDWPPHLAAKTPTAVTPLAELQGMLSLYFGWAKGSGDAGDLLASCPAVDDMPEFVRVTLAAIKNVIEPPPPPAQDPGAAAEVAAADGEAAVLATPLPSAPIYAEFQPHPPKPFA